MSLKLISIKSTLLLVSIVYCSFLTAQKENNVWYFGNGAGLDFNGGKVKPLNGSELYTEEGSSVICNKEGKVVFYSDGLSVWDGRHKLIPNGTEFKGGLSSTQSALILAKPGDDNRYLMFTVGERGNVNGLNYSEFKLSGPRISIISKNKKLIAPVSEKLAAIVDRKEKKSWVISHSWNSKSFMVFPVDENGVGFPVVSEVGMVHKDYGSGNSGEAIGHMVPSNDGKKLAVAVCYKSGTNVEVFDFDFSTGKVSNPVSMITPGLAYGLEFSPDNTKLYVSFVEGRTGIIQYDLNSANLFSSAKLVASNSKNETFGAMRLAPDGKIYIAKTGSSIDVISYPDKSGAGCGYNKSAVSLGEGFGVYGLPTKVVYLSDTYLTVKKEDKAGEGLQLKVDPKVVDLGKDTVIYCIDSFTLNAKVSEGKYLWSTGDTSETLKVNSSGTYWVKVEKDGSTFTDSAKVVFNARPTIFRALESFRPANKLMNSTFAFNINDVEYFNLEVVKGGKVIFSTSDTRNHWTGYNTKKKEMPAGKYKWRVTYKPICSDKETTQTGQVELMR